MEIWHIWIIIGLIFFIVEMFTSGFASICLSIGCIGGAIAAAAGLEIMYQLLIFAVFSIIALLFARPLVKRLSAKKEIRTNADALIGSQGTVIENVGKSGNPGYIKIDGDVWKAVSEDGEIIEKGATVTVIARNSIILTVKK